MVGVAGKSKACSTCRKRRVKCDLRRPACLTCLKSDRECGGYDKTLIYVNRTASSPAVTANQVLGGLHKKQPLADVQPTGPHDAARLYKLFYEPAAVRRSFRGYATELLKDCYLPQLEMSADGISEQGSYSWVYTFESMTGPSAALDVSLFALCLAQIYVTGNGVVSLSKCNDWYHDALQHLRQDLANPATQMTDETLAAVAVLSTVELFITPSDNGWRAHARGIAYIMKMRASTINGQTPIWQHLSARLRVICTIDAMTKRQAQSLDSDLWRLKELGSSHTGPLMVLYDMVSDLPRMMEFADSVGHEEDLDRLLDGASTALRMLISKVQQIEQWFRTIRTSSESPLYWSVPSEVTSPADSDSAHKLFPFAVEFPSLGVMSQVTQVWTFLTIIYSDIIQLYDYVVRRSPVSLTLEAILGRHVGTQEEAASTPVSLREGCSDQGGMDALTIHSIRDEGMKSARLICQAFEYAHRTEMGTMGVQFTLFPRWTCLQYFRFHAPQGREFQWIQSIQRNTGPGTRWDYDMMSFSPLKGPIGVR